MPAGRIRVPRRPKGMAKPVRDPKILRGKPGLGYNPKKSKISNYVKRPKGMAKPVRDPKILHPKPGHSPDENVTYTKGSGAPPGAGRQKPKPPRGNRGGGGGGGRGGGRGGKGGGKGLGLGGGGGGNVGQAIQEILANRGATPYSDSFADSLAGAQYDQPIHDANIAVKRSGRDSAQNMHDIEHWYGQVVGAQRGANDQNQALGQQAGAAQQAAVQGIVDSLGGGDAAGAVGAQGVGDQATLAQMSLAQNQYGQSMLPLLQAEQAGASSRQHAANVSHEQDLTNQLEELKQQRGAAVANHLFDIRQANNGIKDKTLDRLMQIKQYNNQLSQQKFQNRLSSQEAAVAAAMTGAQIGALKQQTGSGANGGFVPWAQLSAPDRNSVVGAALQGVIDSNGKLLVPMDQAWQIARQNLLGLGYKNARMAGASIAHGKKRARNKAERQISQMIDAMLTGAAGVGAGQ